MVVKAIINAIGKSKPKPVKFPEGTKFTKQDSQTLLEEAQVKIDKINAGELKAKDPTSFVKPTDTATLLGVKADGVSPVLTPSNVKSKIVKPPKASTQQKVDEFLTDQDQALRNADLTGNEENFLNFKKINSSDDIKASIEALGAQISKQVNKLIVITRGEKGALAVSGEEIVENDIINNLKIVDLTGAGDLFAAGFLHGYINKLSTKKCLEKGTEMSSKIIQQIGARL